MRHTKIWIDVKIKAYDIGGGVKILNRKPQIFELNKLAYYSSTISLMRTLSVLSLLILGGMLIFRTNLEQTIDEYYIKSATVSLWICVIGCGLTYYNLASNYKKSIKILGIEKYNEPESVERARLFGSTKFEYLSIIISICMLTFGLWFAALFIFMGLLNP
ncbi:MAG: hypothetical protein WD000_07890 [Thermodesulfobacteriota bacterium]